MIEAEKRCLVILVTRINKIEQFYINENMIEFIEEAPDTIITLDSGRKVFVAETAEEVINRIREEKRIILAMRDPTAPV